MDKVILLVEDNESDEMLALLAFKKSGLKSTVNVVHDGVEALDYLAKAPELPALILLDLNLPRLNGLELLTRLRAEPRTKHVPVVVLTSSKEQEDIARSYALGANAYVRKPVEFGQFSEAARMLGAFWLEFNELPKVDEAGSPLPTDMPFSSR